MAGPDERELALRACNLAVLALAPQTLLALGEMPCGADVEMHSLVRSPELNGGRGKVVEPQDPGAGRCGVNIDCDGRELALKPAILTRLCGNSACRQALAPPLLQCSKCKAEAYCCKACQVGDPAAPAARRAPRTRVPASARSPAPAPVPLPAPPPTAQTAAWKAGHKHRCGVPGQAAAATQIRRAAQGGAQLEAARAPAGLTAQQRRLKTRLFELQDSDDWRGVVALEKEALALAQELRGADPGLAGKILSVLGHGYIRTGDYGRAREMYEQRRAIAEALGDRAGVAGA